MYKHKTKLEYFKSLTFNASSISKDKIQWRCVDWLPVGWAVVEHPGSCIDPGQPTFMSVKQPWWSQTAYRTVNGKAFLFLYPWTSGQLEGLIKMWQPLTAPTAFPKGSVVCHPCKSTRHYARSSVVYFLSKSALIKLNKKTACFQLCDIFLCTQTS